MREPTPEEVAEWAQAPAARAFRSRLMEAQAEIQQDLLQGSQISFASAEQTALATAGMTYRRHGLADALAIFDSMATEDDDNDDRPRHQAG